MLVDPSEILPKSAATPGTYTRPALLCLAVLLRGTIIGCAGQSARRPIDTIVTWQIRVLSTTRAHKEAPAFLSFLDGRDLGFVSQGMA